MGFRVSGLYDRMFHAGMYRRLRVSGLYGLWVSAVWLLGFRAVPPAGFRVPVLYLITRMWAGLLYM